MVCNKSIAWCPLVLLISISLSHATLMTTPEPAMDPLSAPQLVVISAGRPWSRRRIPEKTLTDGVRICPRHYPKGFSVRCDYAEQVSKARFYVDDVLLRTEYREPYYIAGNKKVVVKPWGQKLGKAKVTCRLGRKAEVSAIITIGC